MITIKKYSNRRLYDTSQSSYITLEDLADKIRQGNDVRVVDAKSDEDLTQQVLAQIILESRGAAKLLPVPLLMRLIRMGEDNLAEFFSQYMSWSLEIYLRFKQGYEKVSPYNPFGSLPFAESNPLMRMFGGQKAPWDTTPPWQDYQSTQQSPTQPAPPPEPEEPGLGEQSSEEVAAMRKEIDELKELVKQMAGNAGD
ncbi:polyhydroxyalkanoate synthesis regulator DNA-binding domain-containing protein [Persicimonas caeni]|nr:polyhydroxyalkanoate synthesis regulator DNA-binding domain-containing protein [Persicimonas caeni]